jgi:hypothetical protein
MLTLDELIERLQEEDESVILELLDLTPTKLIDELSHLIEEQQDKIRAYYDDDAEELYGEEATDESSE